MSRRDNSWWRRSARAAAFSVVAIGGGATGAAGCLDRPVEPVTPRTTSTIVERLTQSSVDKIDLLLGIDNSRSMADKQQILALAIPDLVKGLLNPLCVNPDSCVDNVCDATGIMQPPAPFDAMGNPVDCPAGTEREFDPISDVHIGIVTSSLGGHGADSCPDQTATGCGMGTNTSNNDKAHLIARSDQCGGAEVPTWQEKNFLAWDPTGKKKMPPGEKDLDNLGVNLADMVEGTGQIGCGYEAQLESIYRFLVDPSPFAKITVAMNSATPEGTDDVLLQQRRDFLRPNSLLAVIMLTDENDCSIRDYGQYFYAALIKNGDGTEFHLPKARSVCADNPLDPCCKSCGQGADGCGDDPACGSNHDSLSDNINLRCFEQKRRFGIDFLYPVERYVNAFSLVAINPKCDALTGCEGATVPNPIYTDLDPNDDISGTRDTGLTFFAGIVGVPWQLIAKDPTDLKKGFKNAEELAATDEGSGKTTWDIILGNPAEYKYAEDIHMHESVDPRPGLPTSGNTDPFHGHEYDISAKRNDLQYACIFDLPGGSERDCTDPMFVNVGCDCDPTSVGTNNPLCAANPNDMGEPTLQTKAKGYPGLRQLDVLRRLGPQGITASVCPAQLSDNTAKDFGYRPAIGAIIDRLKTALGGQCLPRSLSADSKGQVQCVIIEARRAEGGQDACDKPDGRRPVEAKNKQAIEAAKADPIYTTAQWNSFCEIVQLENPNGSTKEGPLFECQQNKSDAPTYNNQAVNGWCYIDATTAPPTGNVELVSKCPDTERRLVRFVGTAEAQAGATLFITCTGD